MNPEEVLKASLGKKWRRDTAEKVSRLRPEAQARLYLDCIDCLDQLAAADVKNQPAGQVWAYAVPREREHYRWLSASLFADRVLLECPRWDTDQAFTFRTKRGLAAALAGKKPSTQFRSSLKPQATPGGGGAERKSSLDAIDQAIDEVLSEEEEFRSTEEDDLARFRAQVPGLVDEFVSFLMHLIPALEASRLSLVRAWDPSWRHVVRGCRESVDDWGWTPFGEQLMALRSEPDELAEVVSLYKAGQMIGRERAPLVPSSPGSEAAARLFVSHWRTVNFGIPMISGPTGTPARSGDLPYDQRPALFENLTLPALPELRTADPAVYTQFLESAQFASFVGEMRHITSHLTALPAAELADRLAEGQVLLSSKAKAARQQVEKASKSSINAWFDDLGIGTAATAITTLVGLVIAGPPGAIGGVGAAIGLGLRALLKANKLDPVLPVGAELALFSLRSGVRVREPD